jgi:hypothetical protein
MSFVLGSSFAHLDGIIKGIMSERENVATIHAINGEACREGILVGEV